MGVVGDKSRSQPVEVLVELLARAKRKGASAAEAVMVHGASMSVTYRLGKRENLNRAEGRDMMLMRRPSQSARSSPPDSR